jgi:hypothetical protein
MPLQPGRYSSGSSDFLLVCRQVLGKCYLLVLTVMSIEDHCSIWICEQIATYVVVVALPAAAP